MRGEGLRFIIEAASWAIICTFLELECGVEERLRAGVGVSITISVRGDLCGVEPRVHICFKYTTSKDISAERLCNEGTSFTHRNDRRDPIIDFWCISMWMARPVGNPR